MKKLSVLLLSVLLSSCASVRYGNFTNVSAARDVYLAQDAVSQLTRIYPPAKNTFYIRQKICDGFGLKLVQMMRKKGYGVVENPMPRSKANFFYVVDETEPGHLYRVSLYLGSQILSRGYADARGKLTPVSPWSHKE